MNGVRQLRATAKQMRNWLSMTLFSRRILTDAVARNQIAVLSEFENGLMCPDKWNDVEPIRTPFDPADLSDPLKKLTVPHGEFFYKKGRPAYLSGEIWNLTHPPTARFPGRLFSNYWTGRFEGKWSDRVGVDKVEGFVSEIFRASGSDFALLTPESDLKAKNTRGQVVSYQGLDLGCGIPGLYWINFFSKALAEWLGVCGFPKELATPKHLAGGGISLRFCERPEQCNDIETIQKQRAAINWLGPERFFDIFSPNRKLETPDWSQLPTVGDIVR
jgi:hypothetical protein